MPPRLPTPFITSIRTLRQNLATTSSPPSYALCTRDFSTHPARLGGHGQEYDPPTGWLFGVPPGEKYKEEGWEKVWMWGFFGSFGVAIVAYAYKPDTSIQTWALEEARRRLEAEGILQDPTVKKSRE